MTNKKYGKNPKKIQEQTKQILIVYPLFYATIQYFPNLYYSFIYHSSLFRRNKKRIRIAKVETLAEFKEKTRIRKREEYKAR